MRIWGEYVFDGESEANAVMNSSGASPNVGDTLALSQQDILKKIIKNAYINLEAKDVKESYDKFLAFITSKGGYEFTREMRNNDEYINISAIIKIPPQYLDEAIA